MTFSIKSLGFLSSSLDDSRSPLSPGSSGAGDEDGDGDGDGDGDVGGKVGLYMES